MALMTERIETLVGEIGARRGRGHLKQDSMGVAWNRKAVVQEDFMPRGLAKRKDLAEHRIILDSRTSRSITSPHAIRLQEHWSNLFSSSNSQSGRVPR